MSESGSGREACTEGGAEFRQSAAYNCVFEVEASGLVVEAQSGFENVDLEVPRASWSFRLEYIAGYVGFEMRNIRS